MSWDTNRVQLAYNNIGSVPANGTVQQMFNPPNYNYINGISSAVPYIVNPTAGVPLAVKIISISGNTCTVEVHNMSVTTASGNPTEIHVVFYGI